MLSEGLNWCRVGSGRIVATRLFAAVVAAILLAAPSDAAPDADILKLSFGKFDVYGTYSKRSCAAQTFLRSARGQRLGFSIYWVPGRKLYVMTRHPGYEQARGNQQVQFRFPSGQTMTFDMKRKGARVQADIGFGKTARAFYKLIEANSAMSIELPGVGDRVEVALERRRELEAAMRHCRDWLQG